MRSREPDMVSRAEVDGEKGVCIDCMLHHLKIEVDRSTVYAPASYRCPRCPGVHLHPEEVVKFLSSHRLRKNPMAVELLSKIEAFKAIRTVLKTASNLITCISSSCESRFLVNYAESKCTHIVCPTCDISMCFVCKQHYHFGKTCYQNISSTPALKWKHKSTRACPSCHESIEKNRGCDHMHCSRCNYDFSWSQVPEGLYIPSESQRRVVVHNTSSTSTHKFKMICVPRKLRFVGCLLENVAPTREVVNELRRAAPLGPAWELESVYLPDPTLVETTQPSTVVGMVYPEAEKKRRARARHRARQRRRERKKAKTTKMLQTALKSLPKQVQQQQLQQQQQQQQQVQQQQQEVPIFMRAIAI